MPQSIRDEIMTLRNFCLVVVAAVAVLVLPALAGLGDAAQAVVGRITLQSGGVQRSALIVEHERLKKARRPVIIVLQGGKVGSRLRRHLGLGEAARSAGAVMVYPDPAGGKWNDSNGQGAERDAQFILELVNKLAAEGIADRRRVYIAGIGTGGMAAMRLACDHAEAFAGAAALLAGLPADLADTCRPARPLKFLLMAGTADNLVPFRGGKANLPDSKAEVLGAEATLAVFAKAAGCSDGKATSAFPDRDKADGTRAYAEKLKGCKAPVELIRIEGGGHTIPGRWNGGRAEAQGAHNNDIDAAAVIWDFFRRAG
jgi:polyhydroxybutyrate depolymerase